MRITFDAQLETALVRLIINVHIFTVYFCNYSNALGRELPLVQSGIYISVSTYFQNIFEFGFVSLQYIYRVFLKVDFESDYFCRKYFLVVF